MKTATMDVSLLLSEEERSIIEQSLFRLHDSTKKVYRVAIYIFLTTIGKKPADITKEDVSHFFDVVAADKLASGEWSRSYYRTITYAVKKYVNVRYTTAEELTQELKNPLTASLPASPPALMPTTQTVERTVIESYITEIAKFDMSLFVAVSLAYGALLAPKEIYKVRAGHLSKRDDRLILSVGEGVNHRYIFLPQSVSAILITYLNRYGLTDRDAVDIFTGAVNAGKPEERFRRMLEGIQYRFDFDGIDGKLNIQQFRTIGLSTLSKQCPYEFIVSYAKVTREYAYSVRAAYLYEENPALILSGVCDKIGLDTNFVMPSWISEFNPVDPNGNDRVVAKYPI